MSNPREPYPGWDRWLALRAAQLESPQRLADELATLALDGHPLSRLAGELLTPHRLSRPLTAVVAELAATLDPGGVVIDFGLRLIDAAQRQAESARLTDSPALTRLREIGASLHAISERLYGPSRKESPDQSLDEITAPSLAEARFQHWLALPADHPERLANAAELRFRASLRGAGALVSRREWAAQAGQSEFDRNQARLFDAVEAGRADEGFAVVESLELAIRDKPPWIATFVSFYLGMLWLGETLRTGAALSRTRVDALTALMRGAEGHLVHHGYATAFSTIIDLLDPYAELAKPTIAMLGHPPERTLLGTSAWISLTPVRLALAVEDVGVARRGLDLRRQAGYRSFVDDLLWARLRRIEGDAEDAGRLLASALASARLCRAEGRLALEARLCRESPWPELAAAVPHRGRSDERPAAATLPAGETLLGSTPVMVRLRQVIGAYAASDLPVLVTGETGTGKELVARALHTASPRAALPLVTLNCAAMSESLLESELFGHFRGAFSGADSERGGLVREAGAGTLVLDEIGDASPRFQSSLLRLLERREYRPVGSDRIQHAHCRFVACTNADLDRAVAAGRFRLDLLHRLRCLHLHLPALRERAADIPMLVAAFAASAGRRDVGVVELDPSLFAMLQGLPWPGNLRELRNAVERLAATNPTLRRLDLGHWRAAALPTLAATARPGAPINAPSTRSDRLALIEQLISAAPLPRRELVARTGLAPRTISLYLAELVAKGRIQVQGAGAGAVYVTTR